MPDGIVIVFDYCCEDDSGPPPSGVVFATVVENDYDAIRHSLWLATDAAYKQSVEQLARKRAFVQNKVRAEQIPDFSKEAAVTAVGTRRTLDLDKTHWEKQVREWSNIFKRYPEIQQSRVVFEAQVMHRYLVNSEGTSALQPSMLVAITIEAASEAPDGMRVRHWIPFNASSFDQVPSVEEISKAIVEMAADLTALRTAARS